jgi:glycosyltransferase involved in cell wall biosynthesis
MGVADGWVTHADRNAYRALPSLRARWLTWGAATYKLRWFRRSRRFVVQTETARQGLAARLPIDPEAIAVIPNAVAPWYREHTFARRSTAAGEVREIVYFAAHYAHKRHDLLPAVARELERMGVDNFRFLTTLGEETKIARQLHERTRQLGMGHRLLNLGTIPVSQGAGVYQRAAICFVPSVLETFSATYIESMASGVPIVATDLPFAREICGPAARYFEPGNPRAAAEQLADLLADSAAAADLAAAGTRQLERFMTPAEQMEMYFQLCRAAIPSTAAGVGNP